MFPPKSAHLQALKKIEKDNIITKHPVFDSRRYQYKFLYSRNNETDSASQAASNSVTTEVHRESQRMGREPEHSTPFGGEVKNKWSWYILIFLYIFKACTWKHVSLRTS